MEKEEPSLALSLFVHGFFINNAKQNSFWQEYNLIMPNLGCGELICKINRQKTMNTGMLREISS
ncbi:MAG: hypothetical protein WA125_14340 [Desulfosporosinus sp.]